MKKITSLLTAITIISGMTFTVSAEESTFALGDVDMDGVITGHDTAMVSRYLTEGDITLTEEQLKLADVDGDGKVTQSDADKLYNEMQEYKLGDVDMDGLVEIEDSVIILRMYVLQKIDPEIDFGEKGIRADVDCNGVVDIYDAYCVLNFHARTAAWLSCFDDGLYYDFITAEEEQKILEERGIKKYFPEMNTLKEFHDSQLQLNLKSYMDIDGDEAVTISDATTVLQMYAENAAETGIYKASADENEKADVNLDGKVDIDDAMLILKAYAMNAAGLL